VEECPESVQVKTSKGWLALHLVLELNYVELHEEVQEMYETAQFLLDAFPQSVLEATTEGFLPLHVAAMTGYGFQEEDDDDDVNREVDFLRDLVNRAPMAVRVASEALHFPFQSAIQKGHLSVPALRFLAEQFPGALRQLDDEHGGHTVMHMAVSRNHPRLNYVLLLAELRPELLGATDRNGSTPLHTAANQVQSFLDVLSGWSDVGSFYLDSGEGKRRKLRFMVRYLVEQRPQSLMEADHQGYVPLHVAVSRIVPDLNMVKLMVEARPEALLAADHTGCLPLHVAVALDETTPALEEFLAANIRCNQEDDPAALAVRGHQDRRHYARTFELVQLLVEPSPRSVRHKNKDGMLPLLVAAANDAPIDVLFYLSTTWPEAIYGSRRRGGRQE
jgi:hypothetical protein